VSTRRDLILAVSALLLGGCAAAASPRIVLVRAGEGTKDAFEVQGLDEGCLASPQAAAVEWDVVFRVFVESVDGTGGGELPPLLGSTRLEDGALLFEPRFPLEPGLRYRARLERGFWSGDNPEADHPPMEEVFALAPRPIEPTTAVDRVYPSARVLPQNQLKFYIHFSGPMRRGQAYSRVRLVDASGQEVDAPFLELGEELWDPSGTRFTLFFDPGRVKRGLLPHDEVGPPLRSGKTYALIVDAGWLDAGGAPLKEAHRKEFEVSIPDYDPPEPKAWKLSPPTAGTREPLAVAFGEPLDHALLQRLLHVRDRNGAFIAGEVTIGAEEREWSFWPEAPWQQGRHEILVETAIEDLAGNSIGRPFEVDASRGIESRLEPKTVTLPFEVAAAQAGN